jgi:hypothetical protein
MALGVRTQSVAPDAIGLQPATRNYIDTARWPKIIPEPASLDVGQSLLSRKYDVGITLRRFADENPEGWKVKEAVGEVLDAWIVYARSSREVSALQIWPASPAARRYRDTAGPSRGDA